MGLLYGLLPDPFLCPAPAGTSLKLCLPKSAVWSVRSGCEPMSPMVPLFFSGPIDPLLLRPRFLFANDAPVGLLRLLREAVRFIFYPQTSAV